MTERIHDEELDTSEPVVRALLGAQCPELSGRPMTRLSNSGTTNALWRLRGGFGDGDCVVRLPRKPDGERSVLIEHELLPALAMTPLARTVAVPTLLHSGVPPEAFPLHWAVTDWIGGEDAWSARDRQAGDLAVELARVVRTIRNLEGLPAPARAAGSRGGPMNALLERLGRWLDDPSWSAHDLIDVALVRRIAAEAAEVEWESPCFVHGDLIPGNLLTRDGRLSAVIDWGGAGHGDPAQDLTPAWAVLDAGDRAVFRRELEVDQAAWIRGRTIALEQAVGGVLYYVPRGHALGDVMARTLDRIVADPHD